MYLDLFENFKCLDSVITADGRNKQDIRTRIGQAKISHNKKKEAE